MKVKLFLFLIVLLATFLRFYQLADNPPSLTWDEAAWGYNAYSIGVDGKDEFGRFLPITYLESFGDFKPPMYAYLDIIPVKLFGLNEFSTRFPSAFFGTLTVLVTYFLVNQIFNKSKNKEKYALLASLFLAISPWHILLSRAAFEANVASFFIVSGIYFFLKSTHESRWQLSLSVIFFAASMYTFNTARIISPILFLILLIYFRKEIIKEKLNALVCAFLGIIILFPLVLFLFTPQAQLRFKEVNIFSDSSIIKLSNQEITNDNNALWSKVIHNRRVLYSIEYIKHYFDNLNPSFLFVKGDGNPKFSIQSVGQMYIWDILFLISGLFILLKKRESNWWIIPIWLLVGIIPAATARETPHALRIESTLPTFQILVAYGLINLLEKLSKNKFLITSIVSLLLLINFAYFFHTYFLHYPKEYSGEWQYGYKESIDYVKSVEDQYDFVQVTNSLGRPYIYYLFYTKTPPAKFRETASIKRDAFGFVTVESFGKYLFPDDYSYEEIKSKKVLYVNTPYNLPKGISIKKSFYLRNGEKILVAFTL